MTLQELSKDILRLLQKSNLVDDSRLSERHIRYKINQYRAQGIRETYEKKGEIEPVWLQPLSSQVTTQTTNTLIGAATGFFSFRLFDAVATFQTSGVKVGDTVLNTTNNTSAIITSITNDDTLFLNLNIFPSGGENYEISVSGTPKIVKHPYTIFSETNSGDDTTLPACDCPIGKLQIPPIVSLSTKFGGVGDQGIHRVSTASRQEKYFPISIDRFFQLEQSKTTIIQSSRLAHNYYFRVGNIVYISPFREKMSLLMIFDNPLDAGITATDEYPVSFTMGEFIVMKILTQDFNIEAKIASDLRNDAADALVALQQAQQS